jgi:hypothetical protein
VGKEGLVMANEKTFERNLILKMVLAVGLICVGLLGCGGGEESAPKSKSANESVAPVAQKTVPAGWKTYQCQPWSISFPSNWNGDEEAGIWWPGEGNLDMGRPAINVHCGGTPLMPNRDFEDRVVSFIRGEPQERQNVSVSGLSGFTCSWEIKDKRHLGIFLEEKIGAGMGVVHFVDCQAPRIDFDQYKGDFEKILASLKK